MTEIRMRVTRLVVPTLSGALLLAGCMQTPRTHVAVAPPPPPVPDASAEVSRRVRDLSRQAEDYDVLSHQLPGKNAEEHRALMVKVFASLQQILPLLHGSSQSLMFSQQLMIIGTSRQQLAGAPSDMTIEPTVDTGLRAAYNALLGISRHPSLDAAALDGPLTQLKTKLDELDATRGLTHQVVAAEAVELSAGVVTKMADMFTAELVTDSSTQPTTEPATTGPATTEPAATEPMPTTVPRSIEPSNSPVTQPTIESAKDAATAPATEPAPDATTAPAADATTAPSTEPSSAPSSEPAPTSAPDQSK